MAPSKTVYVGIDLLPARAHAKGPAREVPQRQKFSLGENQDTLLAASENHPALRPSLVKGTEAATYTALDSDLHLQVIGAGSLADVLAYIGGQAGAFVAINAPRRPSMGLMRQDTVRQSLEPPPRNGSWLKYRVAEYQLQLPILPTPDDVAACPEWMRRGFELYDRLGDLGYNAYPAESEAARVTLETNAYASFYRILGHAPLPASTLEGRLQRQLILHEMGVRVADPMDFFEDVTTNRLLHGSLPLRNIHTPNELDALVAAVIAWLADKRSGQVNLLGAPEEGQIIVPHAGLLNEQAANRGAKGT